LGIIRESNKHITATLTATWEPAVPLSEFLDGFPAMFDPSQYGDNLGLVYRIRYYEILSGHPSECKDYSAPGAVPILASIAQPVSRKNLFGFEP
jgi:hypothetical protein